MSEVIGSRQAPGLTNVPLRSGCYFYKATARRGGCAADKPVLPTSMSRVLSTPLRIDHITMIFFRSGRNTALRLLMAAFAALATSAAAAIPTTVPVDFLDGLPVVTVKLGDLTADFLVDTGGQIGITVPQPLTVSAADVTLRDEFEKRGDAAGHVTSVQKLTAQSVVVGGQELGPVDGLVNYQWGLSIGGDEVPAAAKKGVIGFKALSTKNVLFDFPHQSMILFDRKSGERPDVSHWEKTAFSYDARGVVVKLQFHGIEAALALDTASTASMIKRNALIFKKQKSPCSVNKRDEQFCGIMSLHAQSNGADLGRMKFVVAQMGPLPFDGVIGADFFNSHRVFVDFDSETLYVESGKK